MPESMLTTVDNPFNPFTQFNEWYAFDEAKGYNSSEYLARITEALKSGSELDEEDALEAAINEIVKYNLIGLYKKIVKEDVKA